MVMHSELSKLLGRSGHIVEALLDVRVSSDPVPTQDLLSEAIDTFKDTHPILEEQRRFQTILSAQDSAQPAADTTSLGITGLTRRCEKRGQVIQYQVDGFTYNQVGNYSTWNDFLQNLAEPLEIYLSRFANGVATRVGVRYINRLPLFGDEGELQSLLTAPPLWKLGPEWSDKRHLTRMQFSNLQESSNVIITQAIEDLDSPPGKAIIIDIDAFIDCEAHARVDDILNLANRLRVVKNMAFNNTLHEEVISCISTP